MIKGMRWIAATVVATALSCTLAPAAHANPVAGFREDFSGCKARQFIYIRLTCC